MPKTRNDVVKVVADTFLPLELAVQNTAADAARCVATLIEQRLRAKLPPTAGAEAIALTSEAAQHLVRAAAAVANAHAYLAEIGHQLDPHGYGADCEPDPTVVGPTAEVHKLQLVPAAA